MPGNCLVDFVIPWQNDRTGPLESWTALNINEFIFVSSCLLSSRNLLWTPSDQKSQTRMTASDLKQDPNT